MIQTHTRAHTVALVFIFIVVFVVGGAVLAGTYLWAQLGEPYKGYAAAETFVEVPPGASGADIRRRLVDAGVVRDEYLFRAALWWRGDARALQAGEYRFDAPISPLGVVDKLARGDVYLQRITFPEGLTLREMARLYEARGWGEAPAFLEAARDSSLVADLDPDAPDLEGYLFPETYALPRQAGAARLVRAMVDRFRSVYTEELRSRADEQGLTTRQVVTIASLVEKETAHPDEHALVAAVYRNRLRIGMPMQADPTVIYALTQAGVYDGNLTRENMRFDSPYNTYRYPGLPPGPIAAPGRAALAATVAPADVKYLYVVSRNDGSHVFAETLTEHNRNVYEHQILYFRQLRQQQRAQ